MNQGGLFSSSSAIMHSAEMRTNFSIQSRNKGWTSGAPPKVFPVAQLRKLRDCEQVAAVCYRMRENTIEFLLVRTRGGRWIFPKGNVEPGLTHAQAAALEAYEEAGVHGRMQEESFVRYKHKGRRNSSSRTNRNEFFVNAHLCEVSRLSAPQEINRTPTWFSAEKTKRCLREDRLPDYAVELCRVIDRAVTCIRRHANKDQNMPNVLRNVRFIDNPRGTFSKR